MDPSRPHRLRRTRVARGYGAALAAGTAATTRRVEEMHGAIARVPFRVLRRIPLVAPVAWLVERIYFAITGRAYVLVRRGGSAGIAAATRAAGRHGRPVNPGAERAEGLVRGALNGSHGDFLAETTNPLAAEMGVYVGGRRVPLTPDGLRAALPEAGERVCVFIHGICMDESAWQWGRGAGEAPGGYGERLQEALGFTPLYLRYNTGLPVAASGRELAGVLQALVDAYPGDVREVALVGHSMGGLVAHYACAEAAAAGLGWVGRTRVVIALGSPFRGSPLAKAGYVATEALHGFDVTAPLGALADARSAGVKDLRLDHGAGRRAAAGPPHVPSVAYRYLSGSLLARRGGRLGRVLGDGLVPPASAAPPDRPEGADAAHVDRIGHLGLLNEPRVYAQIERWLSEG